MHRLVASPSLRLVEPEPFLGGALHCDVTQETRTKRSNKGKGGQARARAVPRPLVPPGYTSV